MALRVLRSQEWASTEPPDGTPFGRQQVEPVALELGGALPELSPPSPVDARLLSIHTHRHLPTMAARTRQSLQRMGANERTRPTRTRRISRDVYKLRLL
jgi:hypothetical protein